jgi:hypothetical protein
MCVRSLLEGGLASEPRRPAPIRIDVPGRQRPSIDKILSVAFASERLHASARILPIQHICTHTQHPSRSQHHTQLVARSDGLSRPRMRNVAQRSTDAR